LGDQRSCEQRTFGAVLVPAVKVVAVQRVGVDELLVDAEMLEVMGSESEHGGQNGQIGP
jgi:hypothetical protein